MCVPVQPLCAALRHLLCGADPPEAGSVLDVYKRQATAHHNELSAQIKAAEKRMAEIAVLRTHIVNYAKTREVYVAYRKAGYSKTVSYTHLDVYKRQLVHSGTVDPSQDNMLKITSDGRKLGLDQRIVNQMLPDEPGTKVKDRKSTRLNSSHITRSRMPSSA